MFVTNSVIWVLKSHNFTLKAAATATAATPAYFYHFRRPKFNLQPFSFTFETFSKKNLKKTKIDARVNVKKTKAKNLKRLWNFPRWSGDDFLPKSVITFVAAVAAATAFRILYWWRQQRNQSCDGCLEIFKKITILLTVTVLFLFSFFRFNLGWTSYIDFFLILGHIRPSLQTFEYKRAENGSKTNKQIFL
jgi:hypothetical protein